MIDVFMMKLKPASEKYGLTYDRLRKMCLAGELAHIRSGRDIYLNVQYLEQYLATAGLKDQESDQTKP